ncbi:uncharacterized protein LOC130053035 [Ostrea edulis]|uniref:uncharacterized protein LOC130053035 n=1 Tax=Ostrea edulis TaxID=37623 RepID=UPI0024AFFD6A|nr:uncharacterized protein LOC130053035 [Ostrea edulis]
MSLSFQKWSILISSLTSEDYIAPLNSPWKEKTRNLGETFSVLHNNPANDEIHVITELIETDKVLTYKYKADNGAVENNIGFVSDDVRHQVMSYFVLNCLNTVEDYENYITLSSVDSLIEYVRPWWYRRDKEESGVNMYLPRELEESFIKKLGINVIIHDIRSHYDLNELMEPLCLPLDVFNLEEDAKYRFINSTKKLTTRRKLTSGTLDFNSALGSFLILDVADEIIDWRGMSFSTQKWSILVSILISEKYSAPLNSHWKEKARALGEVFPVLQNDSTDDEIDVIKGMVETDKVLTYKGNGAVGFKSDDVRHQVMSYFLLNCLNTVEDYGNYIRLSSVDSLLEYVRTWQHKRDKDERCMYLPSCNDGETRRQ